MGITGEYNCINNLGMTNSLLLKKSRLLVLAIITFIVVFVWSALTDIPQLGIGLFLFIFIFDIIFSGLIESFLIKVFSRIMMQIFKIFRRT